MARRVAAVESNVSAIDASATLRIEALEDQVKTLTTMARVEKSRFDKLEDRLDKLSAGCRQMAADILDLCAP